MVVVLKKKIYPGTKESTETLNLLYLPIMAIFR
jgi:hypothetical protein|nr:MAG TPA: hypothetical protein [Caudoviricetes sp.]